METQIPSSWQSFIVFIVATGVFSLLWSSLIEFLKASWSRGVEAKYLAGRTAVALEAYAIECWHQLQMADGLFQETREAGILSLPAKPELPSDVNWRSIPPRLAVQVLSFMNETMIEERAAVYSRSFESNPFDFYTATQKQGRAAWALARELRRHFGLPLLDEQRNRLRELDG